MQISPGQGKSSFQKVSNWRGLSTICKIWKSFSLCLACSCRVKCASLKRRSKNLYWRSTAAHSATVHIAAFTITSARRIDCYLTILVTAGLRRYAVAAEEVLVNLISVSPCNTVDKGTSGVSKADEFSEKFQRRGVQKCFLRSVSCFDFSHYNCKNIPWTLKILFCINHAQKALFRVPKICNMNFWIKNDPPVPPWELFRKFIRFGIATLPWHVEFFYVFIYAIFFIYYQMQRHFQEMIVFLFLLSKPRGREEEVS